ncbi:MAG: helix-turn-helix domain-containing protein [Fimbriimonadales bacterium]
METTVGRRLREIRQRMGFSLQEVASRAGVGVSTLSAIEQGDSSPNLRTLHAVAKALEIPLEALLRTEENPFEILLRQAGAHIPEAVLLEWSERCQSYAHLEKLLGLTPLPAPHYAGLGYEMAERIAEMERARLGLGDAPITDIVHALERAGLRVGGISLGNSSFDGALLFHPDWGAFVLVNRDKPPMRVRFTLAHEYGHYLMHSDRSVYIDTDTKQESNSLEAEANAFAGAFLLPKTGLRRALELFGGEWSKGRRLPLHLCIGLRRLFKVSYEALLWRFFFLGWINEAERERLLSRVDALKQVEKALFPPIEADPIPSLNERFVQLLLAAYREERITLSMLADMLQQTPVGLSESAGQLVLPMIEFLESPQGIASCAGTSG